ncbi:MAG: F-type H+-transporting ATPase subunit gamma [Gammaproteobacteria bacterium]|jgi:F-type H+-transporting ATPase subunit gamma
MTDVSWPTKKLARNHSRRWYDAIFTYPRIHFNSLFSACSESLASESASRLTAMQRTDKNIDELLGNLRVTFNRLRQKGIDEELFDLIFGFEALQEKV